MSTDPATREESLDAALDTSAAVERSPWAWPALAFAVVYSWIAGGFATFTTASNVAVFAPGLVVVLLSFLRPPQRKPRGRPVTRTAVLWWVLALGGFTVIEMTNLFLGSTHAHPTWSVLMEPVLRVHLLKSIAYFIWLKVAWTLLHR